MTSDVANRYPDGYFAALLLPPIQRAHGIHLGEECVGICYLLDMPPEY